MSKGSGINKPFVDYCKFSWQIWTVLFCVFEVHWVMPRDLNSSVLIWKVQKTGSINEKIWRTAPLCSMRSIQLERNRRCFEGERKQIAAVKYKCIENLICFNGSKIDELSVVLN